MRTKILFFVIIICIGFGSNCVLSTYNRALYVSNIKYYGKYIKKAYEPMPGEEPRQFPFEMVSWPSDFYDPPNVIEIKANIVNQAGVMAKDVIIELKVWYFLGKLIEDEEQIFIEESKKNCTWKKQIEKTLILKTIFAKKSSSIKIAEINLENELDMFEEKGLRPWAIKTQVSIRKPKGNTLSKVFSVDVIED